jgi:hypothetical protein
VLRLERLAQALAHPPDGREIVVRRRVGLSLELEPAEDELQALDVVETLWRLVQRVPRVEEPDCEPDPVLFVRQNHRKASLAV